MGTVNEDTIQTVWDWCSDAYLRNGKRLSFPSNTDRKKTYQWRYARAIACKFAQWKFDNPTARKFIDIAVGHAKSIGVLHKGLAVLHQSNMMDVCYKKLQQQSEKNGQDLIVLTNMKKWFDRTIGGDVKVLLHRSAPGAFTNLTMWYKARRLSPLFLALSKSCTYALAKLHEQDPVERKMLPSLSKLFMLRSQVVDDISNLKRIRRIFSTDWREMCQ